MIDLQRELETVPRDSNEAVAVYIRRRLEAERLKAEMEAAMKAAEKAQQDMQEAWRYCRNATPGVYSFKDFGRTVVVVGAGDYPDLLQVIP